MFGDQNESEGARRQKKKIEAADGRLASLFKSWVRIRAISSFLLQIFLELNWFWNVIEISENLV